MRDADHGRPSRRLSPGRVVSKGGGSEPECGAYNVRTGIDVAIDELETRHGHRAGIVTGDIMRDGSSKKSVHGEGGDEEQVGS